MLRLLAVCLELSVTLVNCSKKSIALTILVHAHQHMLTLSGAALCSCGTAGCLYETISYPHVWNQVFIDALRQIIIIIILIC